MILIEAEDGTIELCEEQLLAARTSVCYDKRTGVLQLVIRFVDDGIVGHPKIEITDTHYEVSIRQEEQLADDVLSRANRRRDELADHRGGVDILDLD